MQLLPVVSTSDPLPLPPDAMLLLLAILSARYLLCTFLSGTQFIIVSSSITHSASLALPLLSLCIPLLAAERIPIVLSFSFSFSPNSDADLLTFAVDSCRLHFARMSIILLFLRPRCGSSSLMVVQVALDQMLMRCTPGDLLLFENGCVPDCDAHYDTYHMIS